jgi:2-amino-4-hydroxy-6-hydroxymethyldihydropteridine diphosphokinase
MPTCLLGLGSNLGDREGTLRAALAEIDALPNTRLERHSSFHRFQSIGGAADQGEYLNAAALIETTIPPLAFLEHLQRIETRHGRVRSDRWAARTLDIDLLLYGGDVLEMPALTLPHLRMTFRRFVLEPAGEIAPKMVHPIIGWSIERLLLHLDFAKDEAVLLSPSDTIRLALAQALEERFGIEAVARPTFKTADTIWPPAHAAWLAVKRSGNKPEPMPTKSGGLSYAAAAFPKLSVLVDGRDHATRAVKANWSAIVRQPGRGPTLRLQSADLAEIQAEVFAAIESVWPDLGPTSGNHLE